MAQQRTLTPSEIKQLEMQGCSSADWSSISVSAEFAVQRIQNSRFAGRVAIGAGDGESGIYNAQIADCSIGDCCLIENATVSGYNIGNDVIIRNVGRLYVSGKSSFGNGTEVAVLNETGGREVVIFDYLSAQNAYFQAFYRHRSALIENLQKIISKYAESVSAETAAIGCNSLITNCRTLKNIRVGDCATIDGASRLENGSVNSFAHSPATVGEDVIATNFIISSGANVESGVVLRNVFVGQGVHLATRFSAADSLFFSYCQGENGEACAIFAGPYTVTHHKSTLLIGGYYSFMNAGSGTNQSNHHYRLGPSHQGVMERGCKTASDSYVLWPARLGAFSLVVGRHKGNADTSDLPFSYWIEEEDETILIPAATLKNCGTIRDNIKWKQRDTLPADGRLDHLNTRLLTPYTVQKIERGISILKELQIEQGFAAEVYNYRGVKIKSASLRKGLSIYETVLNNYLGEKIADALAQHTADWQSFFSSTAGLGVEKWVDISGLVAPQHAVESLLLRVELGEIASHQALEAELAVIHQQFVENEWNWVAGSAEEWVGRELKNWDLSTLKAFILQYSKAAQEYYKMILDDARKEFAFNNSISYGIDGDNGVRSSDFAAVRGRFDEHPVVKQVQKQAEDAKKMVATLLHQISEGEN